MIVEIGRLSRKMVVIVRRIVIAVVARNKVRERNMKCVDSTTLIHGLMIVFSIVVKKDDHGYSKDIFIVGQIYIMVMMSIVMTTILTS